MWTQAQRRALVAIFTAIVTVLGIWLVVDHRTIPDPLWQRGPLADTLAGRLDPNTATIAQLAAIPYLGEKRATAIVAYRKSFLANHPGRLAFTNIADLRLIRGIGPATADTLSSYLIFPPAPPATRL